MEENQPTVQASGHYRAMPDPDAPGFWIFERSSLEIAEEDLKPEDWIQHIRTNTTEHTAVEYEASSARLAAGEGHAVPLIRTTPCIAIVSQ